MCAGNPKGFSLVTHACSCRQDLSPFTDTGGCYGDDKGDEWGCKTPGAYSSLTTPPAANKTYCIITCFVLRLRGTNAATNNETELRCLNRSSAWCNVSVPVKQDCIYALSEWFYYQSFENSTVVYWQYWFLAVVSTDNPILDRLLNIVECRPVTRKRQPNKRLNNSRCWVTAAETNMLNSCTHHTELQVIRAPPLISTLYKSPQPPLSFFNRPFPGKGF